MGLLALAAGGYVYLRGVFRALPEYAIANAPRLNDPRFALSVEGLTNAETSTGRMTGFWQEVDDIYAARNAAIRQATQIVQYETYFMTPGRRADEFADVLIERAGAGVGVQLLLDHQGTAKMPEEYWERLVNAGIEVRFFRPPNWRSPLEYNSRSHRKLLLIDGQQVLIGGMGVSDHWDGTEFDHDTAPWAEFEIAYEGEVVNLLQGKFLQNWADTGGDLDLAQEISPVQTEGAVPLYITSDTSTLSESSIRLLVQLSALAARDRLWLGSPYFIPDGNITQALIRARENGAEVRVLTMSDATDKQMVHLAARELYGTLLRAGVEICEYQPSMMHAKLMLVDQDWVSTGSANLDPRSYFHNDELNISGSYPELAQEVEQFFITAIADSKCLTYPEWQNRPLTKKLAGRVALLFKNLL
ncbi:MAG: phospholipase D-like domain-containing protein [Cyanobacteria bacterium J069]